MRYAEELLARPGVVAVRNNKEGMAAFERCGLKVRWVRDGAPFNALIHRSHKDGADVYLDDNGILYAVDVRHEPSNIDGTA